jgi:hypothetical protein
MKINTSTEMNTFNFKENCKELKTKFREHHTNITEEDLECNDGRKNIMLEKLQQKLEKTNEDLNDIILGIS